MTSRSSHSVLLERRFGYNIAYYPHGLQKRRVYILPTRNGVLFAIMLLIMLLGAINYDNNMAYLLTFLLSSLTLVAIFFTYRNIAGLILSLREPTAVFAGEHAVFPIQIDNHQHGHRYSLQFINQNKARHWYRSAQNIGDKQIFDVLPDQIEQLPFRKQSLRRGRLDFGRLQVATNFPLGLFRAWSNCDFEQECIVYPAAKGNLPMPQIVANDQDGSTLNKDGNDDFVGVRQYRLGDSSRQIDWKAYARERGLHRKLFQGNGHAELIFDWHDVSHLHDTEASLSQLCAWILKAENQNVLYGLTLGETRIEPARGAVHRHQCLSALALYGL